MGGVPPHLGWFFLPFGGGGGSPLGGEVHHFIFGWGGSPLSFLRGGSPFYQSPIVSTGGHGGHVQPRSGSLLILLTACRLVILHMLCWTTSLQGVKWEQRMKSE